MAGSTEMLAAFRELTNAKQLDRGELLALLQDGIHAALARKFGPNVKFEMSVDELRGGIRVVRLRQVVDTIEDLSWQIGVDDARDLDPEFQPGDMVRQGIIQRTAKARVVRDGTTVYTGTLSSLKRFKDDVKEVRDGLECGIGIENFNDLKAGDRIESFRVEAVKRTLESSPTGS